jgi:hypothetical protein
MDVKRQFFQLFDYSIIQLVGSLNIIPLGMIRSVEEASNLIFCIPLRMQPASKQRIHSYGMQLSDRTTFSTERHIPNGMSSITECLVLT